MLSFDPKLIISCVTKNKGPLTKIMSLHPETGQVVKDGSECSMHSGSIKQIEISSPDGFARMLASRGEDQAIVHGLCEHNFARVATKRMVDKVRAISNDPVIARTKDYITYSFGAGVILFDHDKAREGSVGSEDALASYAPAALVAMLATVHPAIGTAAFVSTPSTSSCIYNASGEILRGDGTGSHTYMFVRQASDIPRYLKELGKRLFLAGMGRIEISRSGSLLERTLVDLMVGSPERLDFVAGAVCRDGLVQKLPPPAVCDGEMLDTTTLPDLTKEEEVKYQEIIKALKKQAKPQQEKVVSEYIEREANKLSEGGAITREDARKIVESRQDHVLEDSDILFFDRQDAGVTVASVLDDGEKYHQKSLADPLEPGYEGGSKTKAKFFWNDGNPIIHSYAHGSEKYRFRRFFKEKKGEDAESPEISNDTDAEAAMFERYVLLTSQNKIIDSFGHDINTSMMVERAFVLANAGKFHRYHDQEGNLKIIPVTQHWLMSNDKKVADGLQYKPGAPLLFQGEDGRYYYNTFRFAYQHVTDMPTAERAERLKIWAMLMDQVFHKHRFYIEDWLSYTIQQPDRRAGIMPLCISGVGLGKSVMMEIMGKVVGQHNFSDAKVLDVTGLGKSGTQWGDWIYNKKISCIEEIYPEGETAISYKILDSLKDIITNSTLPLNLKGSRNGTFTIYSNIMAFSNHQNCIKIPLGDRRVFVVDSTGQDNLTRKQTNALWDWKDIKENIVAVYQYLRDREIGDEFTPGQAKMTKAKKGLQLDGRSAIQTAFDLVIEQYPCDLVTGGELTLAVSEALQHCEGGDLTEYTSINWNAEKQYQAVLKSTTTLVAEGQRIRVYRLNGKQLPASRIRAIRNGQKWASSSIQDIKDAMYVDIPWKWIKEDEEHVPF